MRISFLAVAPGAVERNAFAQKKWGRCLWRLSRFPQNKNLRCVIMNGIPSMCSTKADYDFIKYQQIEGWQTKWRQLIEGRFIVDGDDLVEDSNAPIFRLGFTVEEVSETIGFSGLTTREIEWRESQPDRWALVDGEWAEVDGWLEARTADRIAAAVATKNSEIEAESRMRQLLDVDWNGHRWCADSWATKTIESCCAVATALGMADTEPVRVPTPLQPGYWMTAEFDASGNRVVVQMTVGDMRHLLAALYDRNGAIWGKEVIHKATVEAMVAEGASVADIEQYDISVGW